MISVGGDGMFAEVSFSNFTFNFNGMLAEVTFSNFNFNFNGMFAELIFCKFLTLTGCLQRYFAEVIFGKFESVYKQYI